MTHTRTDLSRRYHADLQQFLKEGPGASTGAARALGQLAVHTGLDTLDIARIH